MVAETLTENNRIVVFIDDLDRLVPEKAVDLLEALKLFLDIKGCVFVLACDYQVIAQGLKQKFNLSEDDLKGKSFFDKLIQVPFNMPVSHYDATGFLATMLEHIGLTYTVPEQKENDAKFYLKLMSYSVGFNPRTSKRLFNNLLLLKFVLEAKDVLKSDNVSQVHEKIRILFATLCLQHTFSSMYNSLLDYLQQEVAADEEVTETNEFFTTLKTPETFKENGDFADINIGDANKLANFMVVFFEAIQLKSDSSENADDMLNAGEIATLKNIMSFSAVVSVEPKPPEQIDNQEARRIMNRNRDFIESFVSDVKIEYQANIEAVPILYEDWFEDSPLGFGGIYQPSRGARKLYILTRAVLFSQKDKRSFEIVFALDAGSSKHGSIPFISHYIKGDYDFWSLFEQNGLQTLFPKNGNYTPKKVTNYGFSGKERALFYQEFPNITPKALLEEKQRAEFETIFRTEAFAILDKLFPKIVELYNNGEL